MRFLKSYHHTMRFACLNREPPYRSSNCVKVQRELCIQIDSSYALPRIVAQYGGVCVFKLEAPIILLNCAKTLQDLCV